MRKHSTSFFYDSDKFQPILTISLKILGLLLNPIKIEKIGEIPKSIPIKSPNIK